MMSITDDHALMFTVIRALNLFSATVCCLSFSPSLFLPRHSHWYLLWFSSVCWYLNLKSQLFFHFPFLFLITIITHFITSCNNFTSHLSIQVTGLETKGLSTPLNGPEARVVTMPDSVHTTRF